MQSSRPAGESSLTQPWEQDSGTLEDVEAVQPEDAGFGETRRGVRTAGLRSEKPGKPGDLLRGAAEG
jgi:hypothetical protein